VAKIDELFSRLKSEYKKALMQFITAGDPDLEATAELITAFDQLGCHICEIGIPYSDPIADGPIIQASYTRALERKTTVGAILDTLESCSSKVAIPLVTMVSYAIIYRIGVQEYVRDAVQKGISGIIVPDLPVEEAEKLSQVCV